MVFEGRCLCGAVRYRISAVPRSVSICHCESCRRAGGAPSVGWFVVPRAGFELLAGEITKYRSSPPVRRGFCARCGTPLSYENDDAPQEIELTTATLDEPQRLPPAKEIWTSERLPWMAPNPALEQFERGGGA